MKKILLLGGNVTLIPVIEEAHNMGCHVITCDYLPNNDAHKYSDEYYNISVTDKESVLALAKRLQIDGIMAFACDPGVLCATYVAEKLNLPIPGPLESVHILQNKGLFRQFLYDNGFNTPKARKYLSISDAVSDVDLYSFPVMVKPTENAGSRGVIYVESKEDLEKSIVDVLKYARNSEFIIEDYIKMKSYHLNFDCFSIEGKLCEFEISDHRFDNLSPNPYTPISSCWPSVLEDKYKKILYDDLQKLIMLLDMKSTLYNVEACLGDDDKLYLMEVSPRGGGNHVSKITSLACGVNLIRASLQAALGMKIESINKTDVDGAWAYQLLLSRTVGTLQDIIISKEIEKYIVSKEMWKHIGDRINPVEGANDMLGILVIHFPNRIIADEVLDNIDRYVRIKYE